MLVLRYNFTPGGTRMNEALALRPAGEPLPFSADTDTLFADHKGEYRKGIEKRQRKLAAGVPFIKRFLRPDERVLLLTTACSPFSTLEQLTTGWTILYLKRCLLVVTSERILQVLTDTGFAYRDSIAEMRFADCEWMKLSFGALKVRYHDGKQERFLYIPRSERKKLKAILDSKTFTATGASAGRTHLCPRCTKLLQPDVFTCGSCRLEFKSRADGQRIALIYPGGGYFYTGHWFLGIGDAIVELLLITLLIVALLDLDSEGGPEAAIFLGGLLAIEKAISVYHTNHFIKEYLPKEKVAPQ